MVRYIVATVILHIALFTLACPTIGVALTLEEELQELTENYIRFKEVIQNKNFQLEETVKRLEDQLRQNNQIKTDLEVQVARLEYKLQQQESDLATLNPRLLTKDSVKSVSNFDTESVGILGGIPTSCADLGQMGHVSSGIYTVLRNATIEYVYCNFTTAPDSPGLQQWIGYGNVTSSPVYFYVQRNTPFSEESTPIPFNIERINVGKAMNNRASGKFTVPRMGTYFFMFSGLVKFPASSSQLRLQLGFRLNGYDLTAGQIEEINDVTDADKFTPLALQATLNLELGDEVWLEIFFLSPTVSLHNNNTHFTCFSGWLLEEGIANSV